MEEVRFLKLHGKHAHGEYTTSLVDAEVYDRVSQYHWTFDFKRTRDLDGHLHGYVATRMKVESGRMVRRVLHWMVMGIDTLPEGQVVDHINGNPLDNRRSNLRMLSHGASAQNRRTSRGTSGYRGVRHVGPDRFTVILKMNGEHLELGSFSKAREAARVWDLFALLLAGEVMREHTNFPAKKYDRRVEGLKRMLAAGGGRSPHGVTPGPDLD